MANGGVAQQFWLRVERERVARGWSASRLSTETARFTPSGKPIPRSTIDNLKASTRAPQPYIVQALTSALGIDFEEGATLAGVLPPPVAAPTFDRALAESPISDDEKQIIKALHDRFVAANSAKPKRRTGTRSGDEHQAM